MIRRGLAIFCRIQTITYTFTNTFTRPYATANQASKLLSLLKDYLNNNSDYSLRSTQLELYESYCSLDQVHERAELNRLKSRLLASAHDLNGMFIIWSKYWSHARIPRPSSTSNFVNYIHNISDLLFILYGNDIRTLYKLFRLLPLQVKIPLILPLTARLLHKDVAHCSAFLYNLSDNNLDDFFNIHPSIALNFSIAFSAAIELHISHLKSSYLLKDAFWFVSLLRSHAMLPGPNTKAVILHYCPHFASDPTNPDWLLSYDDILKMRSFALKNAAWNPQYLFTLLQAYNPPDSTDPIQTRDFSIYSTVAASIASAKLQPEYRSSLLDNYILKLVKKNYLTFTNVSDFMIMLNKSVSEANINQSNEYAALIEQQGLKFTTHVWISLIRAYCITSNTDQALELIPDIHRTPEVIDTHLANSILEISRIRHSTFHDAESSEYSDLYANISQFIRYFGTEVIDMIPELRNTYSHLQRDASLREFKPDFKSFSLLAAMYIRSVKCQTPQEFMQLYKTILRWVRLFRENYHFEHLSPHCDIIVRTFVEKCAKSVHRETIIDILRDVVADFPAEAWLAPENFFRYLKPKLKRRRISELEGIIEIMENRGYSLSPDLYRKMIRASQSVSSISRMVKWYTKFKKAYPSGDEQALLGKKLCKSMRYALKNHHKANEKVMALSGQHISHAVI
ncbi:hypothetical protein CANCADRAFT_42580 [Tortispora caseinolytica NRRL Y-17796]|uniref:Uncharacterized protein n=1 Tax=Tortispora caseinolytica NRRL Y-17796 TaxID=767744 RepID=A0A1E4TJJ7_9ASCO|nr:hypothetical protein CANCADRAFT_42580 [Tortispora caseinolytica NRRL Y-17796]